MTDRSRPGKVQPLRSAANKARELEADANVKEVSPKHQAEVWSAVC